MSLIQATRPKRKNYTICLFSTDPNSYYSPTATPWDAKYFVNLNGIMSQEEQSRPYFLHFTFLSEAAGVVGTPSTTLPVQVFLDLEHNNFPHIFSNYGAKPCGFLKFYPDQSVAPVIYGLEAKTNDNEEVYLHSVLGVNQIHFRALTLNGAAYAPAGVDFSIYIHLTPADF